MRTTRSGILLGLVLLWGGVLAGAGAAQDESDATTAEITDAVESSLDVDVMPVSWIDSLDDSFVAAPRRWYLSGIIGPSFQTLTDEFHADTAGGSVTGTALTGGAAVGLAIARPRGQLRFEFEGRARGGPEQTLNLADIAPGVGGAITWSAAEGWSTMVNTWRDISVTERLGVYAGGGIGAGGYAYDVDGALSVGGITDRYFARSQSSGFAWQVGAGLTYLLGDRLTFDCGYRFYSLQPTSTDIFASDGTITDRLGASSHGFSASELLFTLRLYDPFSGWQRGGD